MGPGVINTEKSEVVAYRTVSDEEDVLSEVPQGMVASIIFMMMMMSDIKKRGKTKHRTVYCRR